MATPKLGRMEKIELRDVWKTEAGDFTPWLAGEENLVLLGDTIGLELEMEAQEQAREYIRRAPKEVQTPLRRRLAENGWLD